MTRNQQKELNFTVIERVKYLISNCHRRLPSYKAVVRILNNEGHITSTGNAWTSHRLFRMLQRNNIGGIHGLRHYLSKKAVAPELPKMKIYKNLYTKKGIHSHIKKRVFSNII